MRILTSITLGFVMVSGSALKAISAESKDKVEHKTVTFISAEGKADGSSEISREAVKECIISLPKTEALDPEVVSDSRFLKEIGGDQSKNEWTKIYTAKITINYLVYRKDLLIVATKTVEGKEPTMRELEKRLPQSKEFVSNPAEGDTYAGRSNRQYYFTKPDDAVKDVRTRALVWLKQQAPLVCIDTK